jgi:SAM-dependent methyltransferase
MDLQAIYARRFGLDLEFRKAMWKVLCRRFFQKYVPRQSRVVEIGAGYCEFINNIEAARKTAVDINPAVKEHAASDVEVVLAPGGRMTGVGDDSADVVFASNFFEHLLRDEIVATLREVHRVLARGGRFLILQPNIRFCASDYWMFFDHITPIDDRALVEAMELNGFETVEVIDRFLPYTTKRRFPRVTLLLEVYLRAPLVWRFFGQQSFIVARKS